MLINLRNALMAGKRLPYDAEVEYLESTGTQWIDTGKKLTSETGVEIDVSITNYFSAAKYYPIFAFYSGMSYGWWVKTDRVTTVVWGGEHSITPVTIGSNRTVFNSYKGVFKVNGAVVYAGDGNYSAVSLVPCSLLAYTMSNGGIDSRLLAYRLYRAAFYGDVEAQFIPVRKGTVGYLYDRVSGKLFGNAGTGDFVLGPDVVPVE